MKWIPLVVLSALTSGLAVLVYDQVRTQPLPPSLPGGADPVDVAVLEQRLAALEADRRPVLRAQGTDPRLLERIEALEQRAAARSDVAGDEGRSDDTPAPPSGSTFAPSEAGEEPSAEAVETFRRLQAAMRKQDRLKRTRERVDATLAKLDIALSERQRDKLTEAYSDFSDRRGEIWSQAKTRAVEAGTDVDWKEVIRETNRVVQREFTQKISTFIPGRDADVIAGALLTSPK